MNLSRWITKNKLSSETGIPYSTLWRICSKHILYLNHKKRGKYTLFDREQIPTLVKIHEMYKEGARYEEVDEMLSQSSPATLDINPQESKDSSNQITGSQEAVKLLQVIADQKGDISSLKETVKQQSEEIDKLKKILISQQGKINDLQKDNNDLENSIMIKVNEYISEIFYSKDKNSKR